MAYTVLIEELHRRVATETQAALFARAMGNDVAVPDPVAVRARFDQLLCAPPSDMDTSAASVAEPTRDALIAEAFGLSWRGKDNAVAR